MNLIIVIAVSYIAVVSLVLKTFHYMRDKDIAEQPKVRYMEESYKQSA